MDGIEDVLLKINEGTSIIIVILKINVNLRTKFFIFEILRTFHNNIQYNQSWPCCQKINSSQNPEAVQQFNSSAVQ